MGGKLHSLVFMWHGPDKGHTEYEMSDRRKLSPIKLQKFYSNQRWNCSWVVRGTVLAETVKLLGTTSEFPTLNVLIQQFLIWGDILHHIMPKLFWARISTLKWACKFLISIKMPSLYKERWRARINLLSFWNGHGRKKLKTFSIWVSIEKIE